MLEPWMEALDSKLFNTSKLKIKYVECRFNNTRKEDNRIIKIEVHKNDHFYYLGLIVIRKEMLRMNVRTSIRASSLIGGVLQEYYTIAEYLLGLIL